MPIPGNTDDLVRMRHEEDVVICEPYRAHVVEVDNGVEGWKVIARGDSEDEGNACLAKIRVALHRAYRMGWNDSID